MTRDLPIASVLIPVYNGEVYLAEAVESALGQTEKNIEVVLVDDGSTDSTRAILRRFALQDARVRVFEEEHRGLVPTLNRGLEVARGKYICRLDADDIAMPDRVEKQVRFLDAHEDYVLVGGQDILIGEAGETIGLREHPLSHVEVKKELRDSCCFTHTSVMLRRAEALSAGGYDPLFFHAEDYDLWVRLAAKYRLGNLPDIVCRVRMRENSTSSSGLLRQMFTAMCIRASFRGASRETIRESVQVGKKDFFPVLRRLGFQNDEIAGYVSGGYLYWAARFRSMGNLETALKLVSEATEHLHELKCDSLYLARVYSLGILVSLDARNYTRAARFLLLALASSPGETTRRVFKRLSTRLSSGRKRVQTAS
jgi:glycosyltransferase involved in cell wall biosynthesis